jgi:hypothetical protein
MALNYLLPNRDDFLGANYITKIGAFIYAKNRKYDVYYTKKFPFHESMYMKPIINESKEHNKEKCIDDGNDHRLNQALAVIDLKQDLISYFRENYKDKFYQTLLEESNKRNYVVPWKDSTKIVCIHLRLYDDRGHNGSDYRDYDGSGSAEYIKNLIESGKFNYDMKEMNKFCKKKGISWGALKHSDKQCAIDIKKLEKLIKDMQEQYPDKEIHVITKLNKNSNNNCYIEFCKKNNITIHSNKDWDYDLWLMIHSEVLILSKSTYSLIAGYYHQGSRIIYPLWGTFAACGLYTKYDKSGWDYYI